MSDKYKPVRDLVIEALRRCEALEGDADDLIADEIKESRMGLSTVAKSLTVCALYNREIEPCQTSNGSDE